MATQKFSNTPISSRPQPSPNGPQGGPWGGCTARCYTIASDGALGSSGIAAGDVLDFVLFTQDLPSVVFQEYALSASSGFFFGATQVASGSVYLQNYLRPVEELSGSAPFSAVRDAYLGEIGEYQTSSGLTCYGYAFSNGGQGGVLDNGWTNGNGGPPPTVRDYGVTFWTPGVTTLGTPISFGTGPTPDLPAGIGTCLVREDQLTQEMLDSPRFEASLGGRPIYLYIAGIYGIRP